MAADIQVLDWAGQQFGGTYQFGYSGQRVAFVPQFTVNGKNQIEAKGTRDEFWVRYFLLNKDKDTILAVVTVSPSDVGDKGLTQDIIDRLGITNTYDDDLSVVTPITAKYIGYELCSENPNNPNPDWREGDSEYSWSGYPNIGEGKLSTPVDVSGNDHNPYSFVINRARPTVSFVGNIEEVDWDDEVHTVSGYELAYANDPNGIFKNTIENRSTSIEFLDENNQVWTPHVDGADVGTYQTQITPAQMRLAPGDNLQEDLNMYRNFNPTFKVSRQIKLIIKGDESNTGGISAPVSASKYYDGTPLCPVVTAPDNTTVLYNDGSGPNIWSEDPISITDVGSVYVTVKVSVDSSSPGVEPMQDIYFYYQLQILPRPIYVTSDSASWNYNGNMNTCDRVTVQGHYNETSIGRVETRFAPPDVNGAGNVGQRTIIGIPLINSDDKLNIAFKGGQAEIGSSNNSFDFEIDSPKPNNYDVRVEFGLLKVNLNSEDIYVFIRGNTKGTYSGDDHYSWYESAKDRSCVYNGGIWTVSGWQVVAVSSDPDFEPEPGSYGDLWGTYGAKNIDFIGKETAAEVSGTYINNITDPEDENFWTPIEYRSTLSGLNFRNNNPNFSDNHIHFIVTPNRLLISKRETNIGIAGHRQDYEFNMIKDGDTYVPEERTISGYDAVSDVDIYDLNDTTYLEPNPEVGHKPKTIPSVTASCWNEEDEDGRWYMGLGPDDQDAIHDGQTDEEEPFESGFINNNKNFKVSYYLITDDDDNPLDGFICIHPLDVTVSIRGTAASVTYNGEEQELHGYDYHPEIWWKSDCEFYNYAAMLQAIANDTAADKWIMEIREEIEYTKTLEAPEQQSEVSHDRGTKAQAAPDPVPSQNPQYVLVRTNYYRALHDYGYFEWTNDGYAHGTEINDKDSDDPDYWNPVPYQFELDITDFIEDENSVFPGTLFHISENFNTTFELVEDGSLTILPYSDEVKVYITGHNDTYEDDDTEHTVTGIDSDTDTNIYHASDFEDYISFRDGEDPSTVSVSGTDPGSYMMGLSSGDFVNINKNFSNVNFYVIDGWLLITEKAEDFDLVGPDSGYKVFDNTALEIDISGLDADEIKVEVQPPDGIWYDVSASDKIEWYDCGLTYFKIEATKTAAHKVTEIPGKILIDPLRLTITSDSAAWLYDGDAHDKQSVTVRVENANVSPENLANIMSFVDTFIYDSWAEITDPGVVFNMFEIKPLHFEPNVRNKIYSIDGVYYDNGTIIDSPGKNMNPCVIITRNYGKLTVAPTYENVTITGFQKTITYDGREHSLTGYTVDPPLYIPLKSSFRYVDTIDVRDVGKYDMGLDENSFDWPDNIDNKTVNDGLLKIVERDLHIITGSDTQYYDDEEPAPRAENHNMQAIGLADTDRIEITGDWPYLDAVEQAENSISYNITHENGDDVKSNYNIVADWGTLKITKGNDKKFYRIMGIRKTISSPDNEIKKVHIEGLKGIDYLTKITEEPFPEFGPGNRMVDEDRFYPILHKLVPIPEDGIVDFDDIICIVPLFKHSKKIESVTWMFENKSTGERIFSKVHDRPIFPDGIYGGKVPEYKNHGGLADTPILNIIPKEIKPGYYDVTVNYRMNHKDYSQKFSSVFMIRKKA